LVSSPAVVVAQHVLLVGTVVLLAGSLCGMLARRLGVPDIVLYLLAGVVLGPAVGHVIDVPANSALSQVVLLFGAAYILFDGGATLRFSVLREVWVTVLLLATIGVVVTAAIVAAAAHYLLGITPLVAALLGATIAATDPATLIPVFRQVRVRERVAQTVISESAANDAVAAMMTLAILSIALGSGEFSLGQSLYRVGYEALIGIAIGAVAGYLAGVLVAHQRLGFRQEYLPLVTLIVVIAAYLQAGAASASGFMAVFVAGVVFGNRGSFGLELSEADAHRLEEFVLTTALVMRMFVFVLLGTQVNFRLLSQYLWAAAGVVAVLMLLARPVTVFVSALPDRRARWNMKELIFMCWTRETGVIPAALAGMLAGAGAPGADVIAAVTFMAVLLTILVQATTTRWLARKLDLLAA
jgi:cell volume regulation protein A